MFEQIINAINNALTSIPGLPTLFTENNAGKPQLLTPWMRSTIIPSEPTQVTIGLDRTLRFTGLVQVDYFIPSNQGSTTANVDVIINWFNDKDNRFITEDGKEITILMAWRGTSTTETDWYRTPIFIRYQTFDN